MLGSIKNLNFAHISHILATFTFAHLGPPSCYRRYPRRSSILGLFNVNLSFHAISQYIGFDIVQNIKCAMFLQWEQRFLDLPPRHNKVFEVMRLH